MSSSVAAVGGGGGSASVCDAADVLIGPSDLRARAGSCAARTCSPCVSAIDPTKRAFIRQS